MKHLLMQVRKGSTERLHDSSALHTDQTRGLEIRQFGFCPIVLSSASAVLSLPARSLPGLITPGSHTYSTLKKPPVLGLANRRDMTSVVLTAFLLGTLAQGKDKSQQRPAVLSTAGHS